jgi:hypothetical protein
MVKLEAVDSKISDAIALVVFYEALRLSVLSIGDGPLPTGHSHILASLLEQGKTTYDKSAKKTIIKSVSNIVAGKMNKETNSELTKRILGETKTILESFNKLVQVRASMQKTITTAKVSAIIKNGKKQPTKAKARSSVKKEAVKHGVACDSKIIDFLQA